MKLKILVRLPIIIWNGFVKESLRIFKVLPKRLKFTFWVVFVFQFFTALTETFTLLVISLFAMSAANPEAAMNHFMVKPILDLIPPLAEYCVTPRRMVAFTSSFMIVFVFIKSLLTMITNHLTTVFSEKVSYYVAKESIRRYLNKNYYWHLSPQSSEIMYKLTNRAQLSQLTISLVQLHSNIICCVFLFTSLFIAQPQLTVVVVLSFSLSSIILYSSIRRSLDKAGKMATSTSIEETVTMTAMTRGIREVITYRQQNVAMDKMSAASARGLPARAHLAFCYTVPSLVMECVGFSTIGGMVIYLLYQHIPMEEIVAAASILMLTAWRILPVVTRSLSMVVTIRGIKDRALSCLDLLEHFIKEKVSPVPEPDPNFKFTKTLELINASFNYPSFTEKAIEGVDLTLKKGQSVGLIGPSGAGKSTLALILSGLTPPTEGQFLVDGAPLTAEGRSAYLSKIGYIPQNPLIMDGTIADNVAFSRWGQSYDREDVIKACSLAAMDFVLNDLTTLDRPLSSNGATLSGGQAQRVAIARALFSSPEIIIFDEATSSLDQANENHIRSTINRIKGSITTIIIAHRLTTVEDCDILFWIEEGKIKMSGPPDYVLGIYQASLTPKVDGAHAPGGFLA
ncbi:MAG: ABC transporter ATP-binding protein/permease [Deltaproteobacteria bacterium]|jgi:ABC-type multidrug transport system fused ATPase/permease subunit|nr:ABC transporter ATP-binding protein/permease [Deltaproteobacteria bacterium]